MRRLAAVLLGLILMSQSGVVWADSNDSTAQQAAYGAGSVMGTLVYAPVKGAFCILGGVSSGFAFIFGGSKAAGQVAGGTCGGTWVITPDELKGKEKVQFVGDTGPSSSPRATSAPASSGQKATAGK